MAALAHGLPVVTTNDPVNLPAEFQDGQNMVLAPVGDEGAFLAAARRLAADATLRMRLSQGAMNLSETVFAWPEIARKTLSLPAYRGLAR
jgi:glycosyltransferase involved in cell wall biosynthesis